MDFKRTIVISDIHGSYEHFKALLKKVSYNPTEDKLILNGDYIDRGPDSKKVVEEVMRLVNDSGAHANKGNHDDMFLQWIEDPDENARWYMQNGGYSTLNSYLPDEGINERNWYTFNHVRLANEIKDKYSSHISFMKNLPLYHEDDSYIYVHAGINPFEENWKQGNEDDFLWIRGSFLHLPVNENVKKKVVHGHTPTVRLRLNHDASILEKDSKIAIDGACAYGYQLNALIITGDTYTSDHVLYSSHIQESSITL